MDIKFKKLSRPVMEKKVKSGEITKELFNEMVSAGLISKGRRIWKSRKVTAKDGTLASMQGPRFTFTTINKDGKKVKKTLDESLYTDEMREFMAQVAAIFDQISHPVTTERVYKRQMNEREPFDDNLLYTVDGELMNQVLKLLRALDIIEKGTKGSHHRGVLRYMIKSIIQVSNFPTGESVDDDDIDYIEFENWLWKNGMRLPNDEDPNNPYPNED